MWITADAYKPLKMLPRNCRFNTYHSFPSPALVYGCDIMSPYMDFMNLNLYCCSTCWCIFGYLFLIYIFVLTNNSQEYWILSDGFPRASGLGQKDRVSLHPPREWRFPQPMDTLWFSVHSLKQNTSPREADTFSHVSRDKWKAVQVFTSFSPRYF